MKKLKRIFLFLALILPFNLIGCKKSNIKNVEQKFLNNDCVDYFYELNDDYPTNAHGSCGYVAIASLLRYYDYKYDDTIIDNKFENNKGLKYAKKDDIVNLNSKEYYEYLCNTKDEYFQSSLVVDVNNKFGLYGFNKKYPTELGYGSHCHIGGYYTEVQAILDNYIVERGLEHKCFTRRITSDVRNALIKELEAGKPAIVSCRKESGKGHIFITYDYDKENDEFYGNSLTKEGYNHMKISSGYKTFEYIIFLDYKREL